MIGKLLVYERDAFFALNGSDSVFWDQFMWLFSGKVVWLPSAVLILFVLCYKKDWRESVLILLAIVLVMTLCDQFASGFCKPLFTRFRPTHHPDFMEQVKTVFNYRGGLYGFISSHATNAFGVAMLMTLIMRNRWLGWTLFLWAALTAYTRVYLGVHFISDVIPGVIAGVLFGYLVYKLYLFVRRKWLPVEIYDSYPNYSKKRILLIIYALYVTVLLLVLFNEPLVMLLHK